MFDERSASVIAVVSMSDSGECSCKLIIIITYNFDYIPLEEKSNMFLRIIFICNFYKGIIVEIKGFWACIGQNLIVNNKNVYIVYKIQYTVLTISLMRMIINI